MKKLGKILLWALGACAALLVTSISLTIGWRPFIGPKTRPLTSIKFEATPQRLERGRYIANGLSGCLHCHSQHDVTQHGAPVKIGTEGGGERMPFAHLPGQIFAPNITPDPETGAGNWSDDQLARAIREGVGHDGRALFTMMPYERFRSMSDEDVASVVVYVRSLPPLRHEVPATELVFPVKYLIRSAPQPINHVVTTPDPSNQLQWGAYLVNLGGCIDCHSPVDNHHQRLPGLEFSGGQPFSGDWGSAVSVNITPDASGISYYDEALFIQAIRTGYVRARKLSSVMPFVAYGQLSDSDLKAMFTYLHTLSPIKHRVENSLPPTYCKVCRQKHGAGDQN
jgi:hypothetical protein